MCECELHLQSAYSPCVVGDDEVLIWAVMTPRCARLDIDGKVTIKDFYTNKSLKKNLENAEFSISRKTHLNGSLTYDIVVVPQISKLNSEAKCHGYLEFDCAAIRNIKAFEPPVRCICVIDDGLEHFPAHAVLSINNHVEKNDNSFKHTAIGNLFKLVKDNDIKTDWDW